MTKPAHVTAARYLIRKHGCYYRPNSRGYTGSAIQAGRYTLADAIDITHPNGPDGPRDGMFYMHEDEINDDDWKAYQALAAALADATQRADALAADLIFVTENRDMFREAAQVERARAEAAEARVAELTAKLEAMREAVNFTEVMLKDHGFPIEGPLRSSLRRAALIGGE